MRWYDALLGYTGHLFVKKIMAELKGVRTRGWNYETPLRFAAVLIPISEKLQSSKDIHARIQ